MNPRADQLHGIPRKTGACGGGGDVDDGVAASALRNPQNHAWASSPAFVQVSEFAGLNPLFNADAAPPSLSTTSATMQSPAREQSEADDFQKLSNEYRPEVVGPLVGERQSSQAITTEYANADPVLSQKTAVLPQKYPYYRPIQGDGNCGWRALAYAYFETLVRTGSRSRILEEKTRLWSLNNLLKRTGFDQMLYEDFVTVTLNLLTELASLNPAPVAAATLLERFNDVEVSSAIITHFRLLTSAWMKTHAETYQPFIIDTVAEYCATQIEPYLIEIEHVGMDALIDVLVKPAGFAVEISYLDRSAGAEVNSHRFEASAADGTPMYPDAPTIYLLYRPGHYDILYKLEDLPDTQVNLVPTIAQYHPIQETPMASLSSGFDPILAQIPGISLAIPMGGGLGALGLLPTSPLTSDYPAPPVSAPAPHSAYSPKTTTAMSPTTLPLRPSRYQGAAALYASTSQTQHYQTPSFKNSPFNPAHFRSNEFQPEIWRPELEDA